MLFFKISQDLLQQVANYMSSKPYIEVEPMIREILEIAKTPIAQEISNQTIEIPSESPVAAELPKETEIASVSEPVSAPEAK